MLGRREGSLVAEVGRSLIFGMDVGEELALSSVLTSSSEEEDEKEGEDHS